MTDNPTPADRPGSNIPAVNVYAAYASTNNSVAADPRMGQLPVKKPADEEISVNVVVGSIIVIMLIVLVYFMFVSSRDDVFYDATASYQPHLVGAVQT